jgi:hypothetical protein
VFSPNCSDVKQERRRRSPPNEGWIIIDTVYLTNQSGRS